MRLNIEKFNNNNSINLRMSKIEQKNRAELSGNTISSSSKKTKKEVKYRSYAMTIFNREEADKLKTLNYKYLLIGTEICPTTKKTHYQTYVQFKSSISFDSLKKKLPTTHIEPAKGNAQQNIKYCKKDGDIYFEDGTLPYQKLSVKQIREMTEEELVEHDPRCHKAYISAKQILEANIDVEEWAKKVEVYYIQGPSGSGKSEAAKTIIRELKDKYGTKMNLIKCENGFYTGTGTAKIAIYDEFRDSHMKASEFINLIDYNVHYLNIKGGQRLNKYELIIITSVQNVKDIYGNMKGEPRKQWERRIKVIDMTPPKIEDDEANDIELSDD